jgi:mRNA-degrading endonuclease toxin of MazEF toxin-antitoxin module
LPDHVQSRRLAIQRTIAGRNEDPGAVLLDQARAIDRSVRMFAIIERVPDDILAEVKRKLAALLDIDGRP